MGGSSGRSAPSTTTQITEPPEYVTPHAQNFLNRAANLSNQPFQPYGGQRVADMTPFHGAALESGRQALAENIPVGMNTLTHAAGGGFMNQNPYLAGTFNRAADAVTGRMANTTAMQGLTNSGMAQQQSRDLNDLANQIYGGQYQADMQNMLASAQALPGYAQSSSQFGLGLGDVARDFDQSLINESLRAYNEALSYPYSQLDVLGNAIGMSMGGGGTTTTTSPGFFNPNPTASMLGMGSLGLGLANMFRGG